MREALLRVLFRIWNSVDGWKSVIGYAATQIPWLTANPELVRAVQKALDTQAPGDIAYAMAHLILALGIAHRIKKQVGDLIAKD